ncbi:c-type cytochrome [Albimonas sp. CAU 1670]|uniref:c-type cytochrome n=1 Tax=Albimonas sp. CAU 1670 TaxID=3032599 RepID=UPI0023DBB61C|nr:c-type cytochrome [Albimonas sp. CAU 1670]MDF2232734.1 c-type cytochrome [Albimonas sp. CAU 1670]
MNLRQATARSALAAAGLLAGVAAAQAETQLERGEYLVRVVAACGNCHTPFGPQGPDMSQELAGRLVEKNPAFEAWAPNITPDAETGVGAWSDAELKKAIREGVRPDGTIIGPPMPIGFYRSLGDDDLDAMVAFLRTVAPVKNEVPASTYAIPLPPSYGPPVESVTAPARGVTAEYGEYLAGPVAHCMECHTKFGPAGPMVSTHLGSGGNEFHGPWGTSVSANLTPSADGIAGRSDDELVAMIREGIRDGKPMLPPMGYGYYAQMTDDDVHAIIAYLRTLPPLATPE